MKKRLILAVLLLSSTLPVLAATSKRLDAAPAKKKVKELTVTMDVKDAEARDILKDMQKQCAIKNLLIDKDVQGKGTFLFTGVPCTTAFRVVMRSMGLGVEFHPNSVIRVGASLR